VDSKENEWVLNKAGVKREVLDTVKTRKLAYYGHTVRKQGSCLETEIMQLIMADARMRGRPHAAWMDNISTRTEQSTTTDKQAIALFTRHQSDWVGVCCVHCCI